METNSSLPTKSLFYHQQFFTMSSLHRNDYCIMLETHNQFEYYLLMNHIVIHIVILLYFL